MKNTHKILLPLALGLSFIAGCATWPSFEALGRKADVAFVDAMAAVDDCRAVDQSDGEIDACIEGVLRSLASAGDAGVAVAEAVCDEVEATTERKCKGFKEDPLDAGDTDGEEADTD